METIRKRIIDGIYHVKKHASGMYDKIQQKGAHIAKGSSKAIILVQKAIEFETHMSNDIRFQDQCEKLAYIMYHDIMIKNDSMYTMDAVKENESYANMEKILMNAVTIYTTLYFMDKSFYMSKRFMKFLIRYPMTLQTEDDVLTYLDTYETHCDERRM